MFLRCSRLQLDEDILCGLYWGCAAFQAYVDELMEPFRFERSPFNVAPSASNILDLSVVL